MTEFLTAPMNEIRPLADAAAAGDVEALQYFGGLFDPGESCVLCDKPTGDGRSVRIVGDPNDCRQALLMPVCGDCDKLPPEIARRRQVAMARALWPGRRWHPPKRDEDKKYLRGSRIKARR